jgi:uncharacterized membrane protein YphA (DoxX/SURF4 family)
MSRQMNGVQIMRFAAHTARYLLGAVFVVFGIDGFLGLIPLPPLPTPAQEFMGAMIKTGYLFAVVKGTEVVVGALLLSGRFVPLALVLLTPVLVNIVLFHAFLNAPHELIMPLILLALHSFLVWQYRAYYRELFTARPTLS